MLIVMAGTVSGMPGTDRDLTRGVLPGSAEDHLAAEHSLHLVGCDPGAGQRGLDRRGPRASTTPRSRTCPVNLTNGVRA